LFTQPRRRGGEIAAWKPTNNNKKVRTTFARDFSNKVRR
jgi:hypothetical protein